MGVTGLPGVKGERVGVGVWYGVRGDKVGTGVGDKAGTGVGDKAAAGERTGPGVTARLGDTPSLWSNSAVDGVLPGRFISISVDMFLSFKILESLVDGFDD